MLILLPLVAFGAVFLDLLGLQRGRHPNDWRLAFIQACAAVGAYLAFSSELLSLFVALTQSGATVAWLIALGIAVGIGWRKNWLPLGLHIFRRSVSSLGAFEATALIGLAVVSGLLLVVAILSPPNNTDSLQYHMARVVHWAQNSSLKHYATGVVRQLLNPIWAELAVLDLRLLRGDDRLANFVQWLAMVGSLVAVSLLTRLLGGNRRGQLAAVAFALSIPMGLMQATSTQNDYVVAFWLISLLCLAALRAIRPLSLAERVTFALLLGLGLLTKGTFYPYALPALAWYFYHDVRESGWRAAVGRGFTIALVAAALNLGYWSRNFQTFGGPLGSPDWVQGMTSKHHAPLAIVSAITRNLLLNFATPFEELNLTIAERMRSALGSSDPTLAGFELTWGWNHEDLAGNPLHVVLVGFAVIGLVVLRRRLQSRLPLEYAVVVGSLFVMLALVVKFDPSGVRLQLPHWVAWAAVFGVVAQNTDQRRLVPIAVFGLILACLPWVLLNRSRPLIGMRDVPERLTIPCDWGLGCSIGSILLEPKTTVLFANWTFVRGPYLRLSEHLITLDCQRVGLRIDSHDPEYLFWWLLEAPQSGLRIETIYPVTELQGLLDEEFEPCAVICTICGDRTELHGLPLVGDYEAVKLFAGATYSPIP